MTNEYLALSNCSADITKGDEERELAILFLDIRNFTGLMESQPQQAVIQVIRRLFMTFNDIIRNLHGKAVETAGDTLYAVFGFQTNLKEAANNAYQAAKSMFQTLGLFNDAYGQPYFGGPLEIGVGLHTGKVFVGEFRLNAPALTVMGLPVNIAARLQAKTKELNNNLLISEDAYRFLEAEEMGFASKTIHLQGISIDQPVRLAGKPYTNIGYLNGLRQELDYLLAISG
ncbi:hypothetical protein GS399_06190 [Pedobacter sp. HMF7647]|uniref:Guanylate cyclase domain-containing protein n=1 Tax=Hufsiella arboris TaxID=2695275 RepID=A0A7K1Y7L0_9SPHI|nr:adenylate/guanylate cyclase domain-containing protein [Hufsiella arboris]MXV50557.1 hypothetical protein [Hufsiella arboris]